VELLRRTFAIDLETCERCGGRIKVFEELFREAGMSLDDDANLVRVAGHQGPHPDAYHQLVYDRLITAVDGLAGDAFTKALAQELSAMASELRTPGSLLNWLVRTPGGKLR